MYAIVKLNAGNDVNGNPQCCYVVETKDSKTPPIVYDEGYKGSRVVPNHIWENGIFIGEFETTEKEYHSLLRLIQS